MSIKSLIFSTVYRFIALRRVKDHGSPIYVNRFTVLSRKTVLGKKVEIIDYVYTSNGSTEVTLKRVDGKRFFRKFPTITARLEDAIRSGELSQ